MNVSNADGFSCTTSQTADPVPPVMVTGAMGNWMKRLGPEEPVAESVGTDPAEGVFSPETRTAFGFPARTVPTGR